MFIAIEQKYIFYLLSIAHNKNIIYLATGFLIPKWVIYFGALYIPYEGYWNFRINTRWIQYRYLNAFSIFSKFFKKS